MTSTGPGSNLACRRRSLRHGAASPPRGPAQGGEAGHVQVAGCHGGLARGLGATWHVAWASVSAHSPRRAQHLLTQQHVADVVRAASDGCIVRALAVSTIDLLASTQRVLIT